MAEESSRKVAKQIDKAGLPRGGNCPFVPKLDKDMRGRDTIRKDTVQHGPKKGKKGYVDTSGRIWVKDYAHAGLPDHWDVQVAGGMEYLRVDANGNLIP